jgi:hypothetical protein
MEQGCYHKRNGAFARELAAGRLDFPYWFA